MGDADDFASTRWVSLRQAQYKRYGGKQPPLSEAAPTQPALVLSFYPLIVRLETKMTKTIDLALSSLGNVGRNFLRIIETKSGRLADLPEIQVGNILGQIPRPVWLL